MKDCARNIIMILLVAAAAAVTACREYGSPGGLENNLTMSMVTYESSDSHGSMFSYIAYDDSPVITLRAVGFADGALRPGQRTMLQYYDLENETGTRLRDVKVQYRISTISDTLRYAPAATVDRLVSNPIRLKSIWRTGNYININTFVQVTDSARIITLVSPEKPQGRGGRVDAYFIDDIRGARGYYYRQAYLSYDIADMWKRNPQCDTLRVYVNDESFPNVKYYDFVKGSRD